MILTKDELVRQLDSLVQEVSEMRLLMAGITEVLRPIDAVETDIWCGVEFSQEQLDVLMGRIESLRRDVASDL